MAQKRIFITGASDYVGSVLTELAIAQGYKVHGLTRSEAGEEKLRQLGATPVRGDLTSLDVLRKESAEADIVMSLASAYNVATPSYDDVLHIDNGALDAIADGLEGSNKPLVTTSGTLFAAPDPSGGETDETAPLDPNPVNTRYKNVEHALSLAKRGFHLTVVRLAPYVYGRGGSGVKLFMEMAVNTGAALIVDGGNNHITYVHVDDAARLYLLAGEKGKAGEEFNGSGGTDVTARQLFDAIAAEIHVPVKDSSFDEVKASYGMLASFLKAQNRASNAKAREVLGWHPKEVGILEDIK